MDENLRKRIIRAAVVWERAKHEKLGANQYRDLGPEEGELTEAVRAYTGQLVADDVGEQLA